MDIGKHKEDYRFYEGYEGERDVIITLADISYHFWDGYFEDIFGNPQSTENGWSGFTRDYNEYVNAFDDECIECVVDSEEYLADILRYKGMPHSYDETEDVINNLIDIFEESEKKNMCVLVRVN